MLHEPHHPEGVGAEKDNKPVGWIELPERLRMTLSSMPKDRWTDVLVSVCPSEILRDATALIGLFTRAWEKSRAAEDFVIGRVSGKERDQYRDQFTETLRQIAGLAITLGARAKVFGELQSERVLLIRYAQEVWQKTWTKAMARAVSGEPTDPHGPGYPRTAPARDSKPPQPRPPVQGSKKIPLIVADPSPAV